MNKGDGSVRCCDNGDVGEGTHPKHITPAPTQPESSWETRLRDLYLTTTPDEEGLYTASISFNWGKFTFEPKDKSVCEFYLATKDSIESFLRSEIETAEARGRGIKENITTLRMKAYEQGQQDVLTEILNRVEATDYIRDMHITKYREKVLDLLTSLRNK